jgi:hypothetical protein
MPGLGFHQKHIYFSSLAGACVPSSELPLHHILTPDEPLLRQFALKAVGWGTVLSYELIQVLMAHSSTLTIKNMFVVKNSSYIAYKLKAS